MTRFYRRVAVIVVAAATLLGPKVATAAPEAAEPRGYAQPIAGTAASECCPSIGYNTAEGTYLIAWLREAPGISEVWARVVTADGSAVTAPRRISPAHETVVYSPAVAYNWRTNQHLVVWGQRYAANDSDIWGQRVRANGTPLGAALPIDLSDDDVYSDPEVALNTWNGQYLVVWARNNGSTADAVGQRLRRNGNPIGGTIEINSRPESDQISPAVAFNTMKKHFFVVWGDFRWGEDDPDIYGQRVRANGNLLGPEVWITASTDAQTMPDLEYDPFDNEYLVVWRNDGDTGADVHGRIVAATGRFRGPEREIGVGPATDSSPRVGRSAHATGPRWLVVWRDYRWGDDDTDISGRFVNNSGVPLGADYFVVSGLVGNEYTPALASLSGTSTGDWLAAWTFESDVWAGVVP